MAQTKKKDDLLIKAGAAAAAVLAILAVIYWLSSVPGPSVGPAATNQAAEQAATPQPPAKPVCELGEPDLYENGYLRNDAPTAAEPGEGWVLEYKKLRKPLQFASLCFAKGSLCSFGGELAACDLSQLAVGDNVRIEGHKNADGTYGVVRLLLNKRAAAPEPAP